MTIEDNKYPIPPNTGWTVGKIKVPYYKKILIRLKIYQPLIHIYKTTARIFYKIFPKKIYQAKVLVVDDIIWWPNEGDCNLDAYVPKKNQNLKKVPFNINSFLTKMAFRNIDFHTDTFDLAAIVLDSLLDLQKEQKGKFLLKVKGKRYFQTIYVDLDNKPDLQQLIKLNNLDPNRFSAFT